MVKWTGQAQPATAASQKRPKRFREARPLDTRHVHLESQHLEELYYFPERALGATGSEG